MVAGVLALVLGAAWLARPTAMWLGVTAHVFALALLANVGRLALLSLPMPFKAFDGAPLLLPYHVPYTWVVPFGVGAALFGTWWGCGRFDARGLRTRPDAAGFVRTQKSGKSAVGPNVGFTGTSSSRR